MILTLMIFLFVFLLFVARKKQREEKQQTLYSILTGKELETGSEGKGEKENPLKQLLTYVETLGQQAGLRKKRREWMTLLLLTFFGGLLFGWICTGGVIGALLIACLSIPALILFLKWRRQKHLEQFRYGLQDLTEFGISTFQIAPDVEALLCEVVKNSKNKVLVHECKEILLESEVLAQTPLKVMQKRAKESGVNEYLLLVEMTRSAMETNSSLVTIYKDMNTSIRRYYGTEKKILAKTSGMRKIGYLMALLPVPAFAFFWDTIAPMLQGGMAVLFYITIGVVAFGVYVLNKVVKVRV